MGEGEDVGPKLAAPMPLLRKRVEEKVVWTLGRRE